MGANLMPRDPIVGPQVWLGADMAKRADWIHVLSEAEVEDLARALAAARNAANARPVGRQPARGAAQAVAQVDAQVVAQFDAQFDELYPLTARDFPLPVLSRRLAGIARALEDGPGIANIRGIPTERFSTQDLRWILWGIGTHLGTAVSQNKAGEFFAEVRDYGEVLGRPDSRGYRTASSLRFHTDRCDVVALLCARQCRQGGDSRIVSTPAIHNAMLERRPELLEELFRPYIHSRQNEEVPGELPYYVNPVFGLHEGRFSSQYSRSYIESAQRFQQAPPLAKAQDEALDMLAALADELCLQTRMEPGDIQLLNNHITYHSRTAIVDFEETGRKRLVYRLWLSTPQSRALPEDYAQLWGATAAGEVRGGVTPQSGLRDVAAWRNS